MANQKEILATRLPQPLVRPGSNPPVAILKDDPAKVGQIIGSERFSSHDTTIVHLNVLRVKMRIRYPEGMNGTKDTATANTGTPRATLNLWPDTGRLLGLSRGSTYAAATRGDIPVIKIGKRYLVPRAALERLLNAGVRPTAA